MSALSSCREATRLASRALDEPLPFTSRLAMLMHLSICGACRAYRRQIRLIDRLVRARPSSLPGDDQLQLSPEARARISKALHPR